MELRVIYEDENVLAIDKPAGIVVFPAAKMGEPRFWRAAPRGRASLSEAEREKPTAEKTLIDYLLDKFPNLKNVGKPPRFGIIHRLDKDTSGILLIAKNNRTLEFLQRQFQERKVIKKYLALVAGKVKTNQGKIETLINRAPKNRKKQRVYLPLEPKTKGKKLRKAITEYKVLKRFKKFTLIEVSPETGRKHQIRVHLNYLGHPIIGDKIYGFKNQPKPQNLNRLFLHAHYLKIKLPEGKEIELKSNLPKDLKETLERLNYDNEN